MNLRIACPKALQSEGTPEASGIKAHINGPISVCTFCPFLLDLLELEVATPFPFLNKISEASPTTRSQ